MNKNIICQNCGKRSEEKDFVTHWRTGSHIIGICRECSKNDEYLKRKTEKLREENIKNMLIYN